MKMTGSIIGPAGKKVINFFFFKLPARLLVRPWPDQPDRLLRPCVWYDCSSKQSGGGQASISLRHLGSDVLERMLSEEDIYSCVVSRRPMLSRVASLSSHEFVGLQTPV